MCAPKITQLLSAEHDQLLARIRNGILEVVQEIRYAAYALLFVEEYSRYFEELLQWYESLLAADSLSQIFNMLLINIV